MSSNTRVYVPVTRAQLAELVEVGNLAGPRAAHAVTQPLRAAWPGADEEELEYAALCAAAEASWTTRTPGALRRYVIAADVPVRVEQLPAEGSPETTVEIGGISIRDIASVHVDLQDPVDLDGDLAWFAPQELVNLLQSE